MFRILCLFGPPGNGVPSLRTFSTSELNDATKIFYAGFSIVVHLFVIFSLTIAHLLTTISIFIPKLLNYF